VNIIQGKQQQGIEFIRHNYQAENWSLQIEMFDPHEPFFTHHHYKDLYPHNYDGAQFDRPLFSSMPLRPTCAKIGYERKY
jgi:hypothetical protein